MTVVERKKNIAMITSTSTETPAIIQIHILFPKGLEDMGESDSEARSRISRISLEPTRCLCLGETVMLRIERSAFEDDGCEAPAGFAPLDEPDLGNISLK